MSSGTVSLAEFSNLNGEVSGVEIDSSLPIPPYVPSEDIEVNLERVARAAKIGHLSNINIGATHKTDEMQVSIGEAYQDGTASPSFTGTLSATSSLANAIVDTSSHPQFSRAESSVSINFGHSDFDDADLRDPKVWAKHLDAALRSGLREASLKKLANGKLRATSMAIFGLNSGVVLPEIYNVDPPLSLAIAAVVQTFGTPLLCRGPFGEPQKLRDNESSLFAATGLPLDRIILSSMYTRTRRFAKVKKSAGEMSATA